MKPGHGDTHRNEFAMISRKFLRIARLTEDRIRQLLRLNESEAKRARDAQAFWSKPITTDNSFWWHARNSTPYVNADEKWLRIGQRHTQLFADFARSAGIDRPVGTIVEWGCGGGANAVAFANECRDFWGVDVSTEALAACAKELADDGQKCRFHPVKIEVSNPEVVLDVVPNDVDLFVSFYVFELFHSEEYGMRILKIAHKLLKPGGVALIQVKYATSSWKTRSRRWAYKRGAGNMTTYRIEDFWTLAESVGFEPKTVTLLPKPPEVPDVRYAYFTLQKPKLSR